MPLIDTKNNLPGMGGLIMYRKEMGFPFAQFVDVVLNGDSEISRFERELICAFISFSNNCEYCFKSHTAVAAQLSGKSFSNLVSLFNDFKSDSNLLEKRTSILLNYAEIIRLNNTQDIDQLTDEAQKNGFSEQAIHDIILTASLASMFNRYVDAMKVHLPENDHFYQMIAEKIVHSGYNMAGRM